MEGFFIGLLVGSLIMLWARTPPRPKPPKRTWLDDIKTFPCPHDGEQCTDLMCEKGPTVCRLRGDNLLR